MNEACEREGGHGKHEMETGCSGENKGIKVGAHLFTMKTVGGVGERSRLCRLGEGVDLRASELREVVEGVEGDPL